MRDRIINLFQIMNQGASVKTVRGWFKNNYAHSTIYNSLYRLVKEGILVKRNKIYYLVK